MTTSQLALIFVGSFLKGCAEGIIMAAAYAFASVLIPPAQRGRRFGLFNATFFLSWGLAGTLIAGPLVDLLQGRGFAAGTAYRWSYGAAVLLTLAGVVLLALLVFVLIPGRSKDGKGGPSA
jgi:MFS family permease